jgi:hypothetical protein
MSFQSQAPSTRAAFESDPQMGTSTESSPVHEGDDSALVLLEVLH